VDSTEKEYRKYLPVLANLLALRPGNFEPLHIKIEDVIAKGAMASRTLCTSSRIM